MATSTLNLPTEGRQDVKQGHGTEALGPSDSTDSGSDLQGAGGGAAHRPGGITPTGRSIGDADLDSDTDAEGTGERAAAGRDSDVATGRDIGVDRVVNADEAGLGGGLDQAEEAWTGRLDDDGDALAETEVMPTEGEAVDLRSGRDIDDISREGERDRAGAGAAAGGVDDNELLDQLRSSGEDATARAESDGPKQRRDEAS